MREYREPQPISKSSFLAALSSDSIEQICSAMVSAANHIDDYGWFIKHLGDLKAHESTEVRKCVAICIGDLARRSNVAVHVADLVKILKILDRDPAISGVVQDSYEDICIFLGQQYT